MNAGVFDSQRRALTFGVMISVSLVGLEAMAVATILPTAAKELGGLGAYGWAFSAFMLANLVGTMAAGQYADRRGPAAPLFAGAVSICAGLLVAAIAPSWGVLILGRALQGLGGGAVMTLAYLSIRRGYPEGLRPKMMAIISSSWVLPSLVGPVAAGALAVHLSWRWVFVLLLPLLGATLLLMLPALQRMGPAARGERRSLVLLTALLALCLGGFLLSLELRSYWLLPACAVALLLSLVSASRVLPPGTLLAKPGLPAGLAFRLILTFVFFGAEAFVPLGLSTLRGFSPMEAGLVLTGASLAWVAGSWTQAKLEGRDGGSTRRLRLLGGFSLVVFGIASMGGVTVFPGVPVFFSALGWALSGYGMGLAYPTVSVIILDKAPEGEEGWISSSLNLSENIGIALGAGIAGATFDMGRFLGLGDPWRIGLAYGVVVAPFFVGLLAARRIFRSDPSASPGVRGGSLPTPPH